MTDSVFSILSLDRSQIRWEEHIHDLSPVEFNEGFWFKREDKFAPLGYGGINGSKLRVCIWLISEAAKAGAKGIVHGAVTGSPQHPMVAYIGKHFGLPVVDCIGTKKPEEHDTLVSAAKQGASFRSFNPGYAATLNSKAKSLSEGELKGYFHLETNITVDEDSNPPARIEAFHKVGSVQVSNIPDHIETLVVPAGSCNSVTSVLYGIALHPPKNLKTVVLMGIGSYGSKDPTYIYHRLKTIGKVAGLEAADLFSWNFNHDKIAVGIKNTPYKLEHYNVSNGCGQCARCKDGYCEYNDLMEFKQGELEFHPRYEAKTWHFMNEHLDTFAPYLNDKTLYWIIGSKPSA